MYQNKESSPKLSPEEIEVLDLLYDIPIVEKPLTTLGNSINKTPGEMLEIISDLMNRKIIRRIAPVFAHRKIGFGNNAMLLLCCEGDDLIKLASTISEMKEASHVFRRDNKFGYNLYAMVHAISKEELDRIINKITSLTDKPILIAETESELKKQSMKVLRVGNKMHHLPVSLTIRNHILILGCGNVGRRKALFLADLGFSIVAVDSNPHTIDHPNIMMESLLLTQENYTEFLQASPDLVVIALGDEKLTKKIADHCRTTGIPVNVVDVPEMSTIIFSSIIK